MEIAVINPQAVLQMYHCKEYPWHSVMSSVADKETIIANADFTTTSAIARRRLSSKKRKKPDSSQDSSCSDGSTSSPMGSPPGNSSPAVTSTTLTPPAQGSASVHRALTELPTTHLAHQPSHTHTNTRHVPPSHPRASVGALGLTTVGGTPSGPYIPVVPGAYHLAPTRPSSSGLQQKQFANPMYTHMQQELNYRYLQEQFGRNSVQHRAGGTAAFSVPHSQAGKVPQQQSVATSTHAAMDTSSSSGSEKGWPHRVKWCCAHITIAKQIQAHQQQSKSALEAMPSHPEVGKPNAGAIDAAQRMTLLQMYGVPTTTVPGYMAMPGVPYSMQELQLRMPSYVQPAPAAPAPFVDTSNLVSVKPMDRTSSQVTDSLNFQMVNSVQLLPYPVATVLPTGMNNLVHGSYVGPVPVIGNCVINPCQPGVMAAPWVR